MIRDAALLLLLFPMWARAAQITDDFSTRNHMETSSSFLPTAVWNQTLGKIHPSLHVVNYKTGYTTPKDFDIGDGSDGIFDSSTYASFSQNGDVSGNKIRLDLAQHPTLNVSKFVLESGWILEPIGDGPLVIKSQSTVDIRGEIWCQGEDGGDAAGSTAGAGGVGRCGGGDGGQGGTPGNNDATDGQSTVGSVTGGQAGNYSGGTEVGGGGGGSWNFTTLAGNGSNSSASGGSSGASQDDPEFTTIGGAGGGGGGSATTTDAGAGGGGGGGSVLIYAEGDVNLGTSPSSSTGFIYVNGGKGGSSNVNGGPGGGGGGGSVLIFSGGTVNLYNNDGSGASQALAGSGGTNAGTSTGGTGALGRSWVTSIDYNGVSGAFYTPPEESPIIAGNNVEFDTSSEYVISKVFDLQSTRPTVDGATLSPSSTDFSIAYRGSDDDFINDDTGWTDLSSVQGKRYVRLKLSIATTSALTPSMIDSLSFSYTPDIQDRFDFQAAGCGRTGHPTSRPPWSFCLLLTFLSGFFLRLKFKAHEPKRIHHG